MKWGKFLFLTNAVMTTVIVSSGLWWAAKNVFFTQPSYFENVTLLKWPPGSTDIHIASDHSDMHPFWELAHLTIPLTAVSEVISHGFVPAPPNNPDMIGLASLPAPFQKPIPGAQLYVKDKSAAPKDTGYSMLLDTKSGSLWIQVFYPD